MMLPKVSTAYRNGEWINHEKHTDHSWIARNIEGYKTYSVIYAASLKKKNAQSKKGDFMKGFIKNIESLAVKNDDFRRVLYTAKHSQLVVMSLAPSEEIGEEVHKLDQFFRVEEGTGEAILDGLPTAISSGFAVIVPAGTNHNIINTGLVPMKLYTLYSPPNHRDGVIHHTRKDAETDDEHFDGKASE